MQRSNHVIGNSKLIKHYSNLLAIAQIDPTNEFHKRCMHRINILGNLVYEVCGFPFNLVVCLAYTLLGFKISNAFLTCVPFNHAY